MNDKRNEIKDMLTEASALLEKARQTAIDNGIDDMIYFDGPAYGMGGWISSGEWMASSHSC